MDELETTACVRHAYELVGDEVGFFMAGNRQLSARDIAAFASSGSDMQYGEVLPAGMERIAAALDVSRCARLCELGSGTGKQALYVFLRHAGLVDVLAVELSRDRCDACRRAWRRLAATRPGFDFDESRWDAEATFTLRHGGRKLRCHAGDLLDDRWRGDVAAAGVLVLQTCFPPSIHAALCERVLLNAADGCRVVCYHPMEFLWRAAAPCPYSPLPCTTRGDTYPTSWSTEKGYAFSLYVRDGLGGVKSAALEAEDPASPFKLGDLVWTRFGFWPIEGVGEDEWDRGVVLRGRLATGGGCVVFYEETGEVDYDVPCANIKAR